MDLGVEGARQDRLGARALLGIEQPDVQGARADGGLELRRVPSAITLPWSITAIPSASWSASSRYWVQQDGGAGSSQGADDLPDLVTGARVEAGGRLIQEHQLGGDDDARRDVETAAHPAGVVLHQSPSGVGEAEGVEEIGRPGLGLARLPSSLPIRIRFSRPVRSSSTEASWPVRRPRRTSSASDDVVAENARLAAIRAEQRRQHPNRRGLAGAVRAEHPVDAPAADREVNSADGLGLAEGLLETGRLDCQY